MIQTAFGMRMRLKHKGFTLVAVLSLAWVSGEYGAVQRRGCDAAERRS